MKRAICTVLNEDFRSDENFCLIHKRTLLQNLSVLNIYLLNLYHIIKGYAQIQQSQQPRNG